MSKQIKIDLKNMYGDLNELFLVSISKKVKKKGIISIIFFLIFKFHHTFDCFEIMLTMREFVRGAQNMGVSS